MQIKKQAFPIGIQTFSKLREEDYLYVDKTEAIFKLICSGTYCFLARPRRFGKSLLLSTIEALFHSQKDLFQDLWIADRWDWEATSPVIHLSLSAINTFEVDLTASLLKLLAEKGAVYDIQLVETTVSERFKELIKKLYLARGKVVILIDEYDKPIIDYLTKTERPKAIAHQKILKRFYTVIKDSDAYIQFLLITGVSKFTKVGIFSDLNNLEDITLSPQFSRIVGYTQAELDHYFSIYLPEIADYIGVKEAVLKEKIKEWYNGYSWDGVHYLYNPFSILLFFKQGLFQNFWFATGTPTFLIDLMRERFEYNIAQQERVVGSFDSYDIHFLETTPLLFQTGYLTIKSVDRLRGRYRLDYPNREVKSSFLSYLIGGFGHHTPRRSGDIAILLEQAFLASDLEGIVSILNSLFSSIPYEIFIANKEAYYHSILFLVFEYFGFYVQSEVSTSRGRIDAVVETGDKVFVLEFKLDKSAAEAVQQIRDRAYMERYRNQGKEVIGIGINFSSELKAIEEYLVIS